MPFAHPHETRDSRFERFAELASNFTTRWLFFLIMFLVACAWIWSEATKRTSLAHVFVGVFTICSLFKISLLANSEKRELQELHRRLDEQGEMLDAIAGADGARERERTVADA
jgi:low affinity Fe/Cu permease